MGMRSNLNLIALFGFGSLGSCVATFLRTTTGTYAQSFLVNALCWVPIFMCIAVYPMGNNPVEKGTITTSSAIGDLKD